MTTRMIQRRGLASQWTAINPVLEIGEFGFEEDTQKFKVGDGESAWNNLPYFINEDLLPDISAGIAGLTELIQTSVSTAVSTAVAGLVDSAPAALDTLNELASAVADDATFANTIANALANKADSVHTHTKSQITDFSHTHAYADLTSIPSTFAPSAHTHNASEITNTVKTVSSATYAIIASDNGKMVILNPSTTITVTVDNVLSVGQRIDLYLRGTQATFTAGSGVTLEGAGVTGVSLKMTTNYTPASIICVSSGVYALVGSVETA